jgi:glycerol uptake facilitator-like aquaporin
MSAHLSLPRALAGESLGTYLLLLFGTGPRRGIRPRQRPDGAVAGGRGVGLRRDHRYLRLGRALRGALKPRGVDRLCLAAASPLLLGRLVPYLTDRLVGAMFASATVAWLFWPFRLRFEAAKGLVRGGPRR